MAEDDATPVVELSGKSSTTSGSRGSTLLRYAVVHRSNIATVIALHASTLSAVGHLIWTIDKPGGRSDASGEQIAVGEIRAVWTAEDWRGRGIAIGMYRKAEEVAANAGWPAKIDHNPQRTPAGDAWAAKVGGYLPPREPVQSTAQVSRFFSNVEVPDGERRS
ncbi:GNAT family N-acetyltransferase [Micromonospora chalcea]|uniref:GNAT family N-acetyltransferase n=1 Tax=Micromonospora TaxID=1873 RepID=UPI001AE939EE|nr:MULTISPECIES: GNAT family N-acetyltransferase [unclassified Micromonospora]MBP1781813.1 GNAT superfamily N-acetyltransferase [Micromonospora sp. HB375]MDH6466513.1 GNAT superfamily N-acetyltransferase [Micromonospora sp. H404/HB375]